MKKKIFYGLIVSKKDFNSFKKEQNSKELSKFKDYYNKDNNMALFNNGDDVWTYCKTYDNKTFCEKCALHSCSLKIYMRRKDKIKRILENE